MEISDCKISEGNLGKRRRFLSERRIFLRDISEGYFRNDISEKKKISMEILTEYRNFLRERRILREKWRFMGKRGRFMREL